MSFESMYMFLNTESMFKCLVYYSILPSWIHNILLLPYIYIYIYNVHITYCYCLYIDTTYIIIHITVFEFLIILFGVPRA